MKKFMLAITVLVFMAASPAPAKQGVTPMLKMKTTYHFMALSPTIEAAALPGRAEGTLWALAWEGTVQGDINGVIRWWAEFVPPDVLTGVGRWELWDCAPEYPISCDYEDAQLIMAGTDAFGYVTAVDWEGKGIVTYTRTDYSGWFGRRITDGGWVDFDAIPSWYGEGYFVIYNKPSNKH